MTKDFVKFIDSIDIREFNKDTYFSPAEIAVIIVRSNHTTVADKIEAIKRLISEYGDELNDISRLSNGGCDELDSERGFSGELKRYLSVLEDAVDNKGENWFEKALFIACLEEIDHNVRFGDQWSRKVYFDNYEAAYKYLTKVKQETYLADNDLKDVKTSACIEVYNLSCPDKQYDSGLFLYNDSLELCCVSVPHSVYDFYFEDAFYIHVPSPFHTGDIVKWNSPFYTPEYGVINHEPNNRDNDRCLQFGDGSDIQEALDMYSPPQILNNMNPDNVITTEGFWYYDHVPYLELEKCDPEQLPKKEKHLMCWKEEVS